MQLKTGDYQVYRFYDVKKDSYYTEFYPPDNLNLERMFDKLVNNFFLRRQGLKVVAVLNVDKESYLNLKLEDITEDYLYQEYVEEEARNKYKMGLIEVGTLKDTLMSCQNYKWTCLKRIAKVMKRIQREGLVCHSEKGMKLYNEYLFLED